MSKNKVDQNARRQIRAYVRDQFTILNKVIRPKPKYIPLSIWRFGGNIFLDSKRLNKYMTEGVGVKRTRE